MANQFKRIGIYLVRWGGFGLLLGVLCGGVGALFSKAIHCVSEWRAAHPWLLFLLPVAGLLTVGLYRLCRVAGVGTVRVMESARLEKKVSSLLAPAVFGGTLLTHLAGGSAGKEGAALQLGGSIAAWLCKIFHLENAARRRLVTAGMAAFFTALFGTPLGASIFALEVLRKGRKCIKGVYPTLVASLSAYGVAHLCGVEWEHFTILPPAMDWQVAWKGLVIIVAGALAALAFCYALHWGELLVEKWIPNAALRIVFGGIALIGLTLAVGSQDYNGGGMEGILRVFETGAVRYEAFALKMLFTVVTVAAGFKGGEIVPALFIGTTLGGTLALLLGLPVGFGGALGMIAVLSGVTNCPIAVCMLALELFGGGGWPYLFVASILGFLLTYRISFYTYPTKEKP